MNGKTYFDRVAARNRTYEGFGKRLTAAGWAREFGLARNVVWRYLQNGMTPEQIAAAREICNKNT